MTENSNPDNKSYVNLGAETKFTGPGIQMWWSPKEPERIHLAFNSPEFNDDTEKGPGLRIVFSSNPSSADYNPAVFNRCANVLRNEGRPAPEHDAEVKSRALAHRNKVIADLGTTQVPSLKQATSKAKAEPDMSGFDNLGYLARALPCPACAALVVDLGIHDETCLARRGVAQVLLDRQNDGTL